MAPTFSPAQNRHAHSAVSEMLSGRPALAVLRYGAHLYGTADRDSDIDIRVVFAPHPDEILLGKIDFSLNNNPEKRSMKPGDIDIVGFSLVRFLILLNRGDMNAIELLQAASHPHAVIWLHPQFRQLMSDGKFLVGASGKGMLDRARGALGALSPDGRGKPSRHPTPTDISHCLRMLCQWAEFVKTGRISFPRPDRAALKQIKDDTFPEDERKKSLAEAFEAVQRSSQTYSKDSAGLISATTQAHILRIHRAAIKEEL